MNTWLIPLVTIVASVSGAYITARVSRKKEPEDRDLIVAETAAKVQEMFKDCLGQLDRVLDENEDHRHRIILLEREVVRLGGDPSRLNGGTVT